MAKWLKIPEYDSYEVSDDGQVRSLARQVQRLNKGTLAWQPIPEKILKPQQDGRTVPGYCRVKLVKNKNIQRFLIHRLVLTAFVRPPINNEQCNHKNGIKNDNRLSNLEWMTPSQNQRYSYSHLGIKSHGRSLPGERNHRSKKVDVALVFSLRQQGWSQQKIADKVGVDQTMISYVLKGRHWSQRERPEQHI